jgi:hypothetical protein
VSIDDVVIVEPASGSTNAVFTVRVSWPTVQPIFLDYRTTNGSAVTNDDFTSRSGVLTINPLATEATISVPILSDALVEANEQFSLILSNPEAASLADSTAVGTIVDSDSVHMLSVALSGAGRVVSEPPGIDCGPQCTAGFNGGSVVRLSAVPDQGALFVAWGGACSGPQSTCDASLDAAKTVTATFATDPASIVRPRGLHVR